MKTALLKNGGWTFQGSREDIILSGVTGQTTYQVTRCSNQTGPHSGAEQFRQRFAGYYLRTDSGLHERMYATSRTSQIRLKAEAESMIRHAEVWKTENLGLELSTYAARAEA
jgi:hypothetical protein